jgi:cellulose synthase/poly-beta-1,6-N-acetylglucosamine synthase-like glycosyltransferase
MALGLIWLIMFLCLMISIIKYTLGAILKWSVPGAKVKKDYSCQPTVSVILPCYNEGKAVYEAIKSLSKSNYPDDKFEVIAQDDCSVDDSYQWMLQAQRDFTRIRVTVNRNAVNSGKARTVCNALQHSSADIIISVDSDCIFDSDAIRELTACFNEPGSKIGAVGGRVGVNNPNDGVITAIQTFIYYAAFHLYKVPENWTRSVGCISGCLFAIRRELLLKIEPVVRGRHWFGVPVNQGEDRFMTHLVLLEGYGTYLNNDALCWTTVPDTLSQLFKQQLRWRQSILRDLFFTLKTLPQHVFKLHPNAVLHLVLTPLGAVVALLMAFTMLTGDPMAWAGPAPLVVYLVIAAILAWAIRKHSAREAVRNPLALGAYAAWWLVSNLFITPLALCTMDSRDWGTRSKDTQSPDTRSPQTCSDDTRSKEQETSLGHSNH